MSGLTGTIFDLEGKVALVTGGSRGLGEAMARAFAEAGADIAIASRSQEDLSSTLGEISRISRARGRCYVADLTNREEAAQLAAAVTRDLGRIDILVNNAGSNIPAAIDEIQDQDWDRLLELNLSSCMALSRAVAPQMKARRWGRIIHISSIMGFASKEARNAYSTTKSALLGLTRASALDLGPYNVTVNCIAPGPFLTDLPGRLLSEQQKQVVTQRTALERWADPRELAGPALLLASEAGSFITGQALVVDGGLLCKTF